MARTLIRSPAVPGVPWARRASMACVAVAVAGCGGVHDGRPATYPAGGIVLFDGRPLAGAQVSFLAVGAPRAAIALTDAEGIFTLSTFAAGDGAVAGQHVVTVSLPSPTPPMTGYAESDYEAAMLSYRRLPRHAARLPRRYGDPSTCGLLFTVSATNTNQFALDLID